MAEAFAQTAAASVSNAGFDVLAETYAPTPAFSWAKQHNALGALVITASHNPGSYLGLKRGFVVGSRKSPARLKLLPAVGPEVAKPGSLKMFNLA